MLNTLKRFNLIGNSHIKKAASARAFGSAVIFDGPFGSGKKTAAALAAAALLCEDKNRDNAPCGKCHSCNLAFAGSHPDIIWGNEAGDGMKVKEARDLRNKTFIVPSQGDFKVFIINRADLMNDASQNALLKVLEEPYSSVFILLTENAYSLLQTVRSRCKIFTMDTFSPDAISDYIMNDSALTEGKHSKEDIEKAALQAEGSIGLALSLLRDGLPKSHALAADFVASLSISPLKIMEACLSASALNRVDFGDFYRYASALLTEQTLKDPQKSGYYIAVYDYIQLQRDKLSDNNAGVFMLSSQLAAFCGQTYRR